VLLAYFRIRRTICQITAPANTSKQLELFASPTHKVAEAMDKINDRWGEFVITPALMMGMGDIILDRISFGSVKELEEIYVG
jgi:hypothetical protein